MNRAMALLKETHLRIKQVSYAVGYRNVSNFNHDFRKFTGLSPHEYRKQIQTRDYKNFSYPLKTI